MKTVIVVQARMSSSRLPGKVLLPLAGAPALQRQLERIQAAEVPASLVVATTTDPSDDCLVELCEQLGVGVIRGHPRDLLARHLMAARAEDADVVVKIPSDCPLIDPEVIERVLGAFFAGPRTFDFVSNLHPATYPDGNDVEVMTREALEVAASEAHRAIDREHTTPFLWEHPERFKLGNVAWETGLDYSMSHRFTLDYAADYQLVREIYFELAQTGELLAGLPKILAILERYPDLAGLNAQYRGVNWYRDHLHELRTIRPSQTHQPEGA